MQISQHDIKWTLSEGGGHIPNLKIFRYSSPDGVWKIASFSPEERAQVLKDGLVAVANYNEIYVWFSPNVDFKALAGLLGQRVAAYVIPFLGGVTEIEFGAVCQVVVEVLYQFHTAK